VDESRENRDGYGSRYYLQQLREPYRCCVLAGRDGSSQLAEHDHVQPCAQRGGQCGGQERPALAQKADRIRSRDLPASQPGRAPAREREQDGTTEERLRDCQPGERHYGRPEHSQRDTQQRADDERAISRPDGVAGAQAGCEPVPRHVQWRGQNAERDDDRDLMRWRRVAEQGTGGDSQRKGRQGPDRLKGECGPEDAPGRDRPRNQIPHGEIPGAQPCDGEHDAHQAARITEQAVSGRTQRASDNDPAGERGGKCHGTVHPQPRDVGENGSQPAALPKRPEHVRPGGDFYGRRSLRPARREWRFSRLRPISP